MLWADAKADGHISCWGTEAKDASAEVLLRRRVHQSQQIYARFHLWSCTRQGRECTRFGARRSTRRSYEAPQPTHAWATVFSSFDRAVTTCICQGQRGEHPQGRRGGQEERLCDDSGATRIERRVECAARVNRRAACGQPERSAQADIAASAAPTGHEPRRCVIEMLDDGGCALDDDGCGCATVSDVSTLALRLQGASARDTVCGRV